MFSVSIMYSGKDMTFFHSQNILCNPGVSQMTMGLNFKKDQCLSNIDNLWTVSENRNTYKLLEMAVFCKYKNRRCGMIVHETATHQVTVEF